MFGITHDTAGVSYWMVSAIFLFLRQHGSEPLSRGVRLEEERLAKIRES